jgi:sugar lactone lactonase YvrE
VSTTESCTDPSRAIGAGRGPRRVAAAGLAAASLLMAMAIAPVGAGATAGGILVSHNNIGFLGAMGNITRTDPVSGATTSISASDAPLGEPIIAVPNGLALEPSGDILVADANYGSPGRLLRVQPADGTRTSAATAGADLLVDPAGVAVDGDAAFVTDGDAFGGSGGVLEVDRASGATASFSANGAPSGGPNFVDPAGIARAADGSLLVADKNAFGIKQKGGVIRVDRGTRARSIVSGNDTHPGPEFEDPTGIAVEADGKILVADPKALDGTGAVFRVDPGTGARSVVSANGAPAGVPEFGGPSAIALEANGDILVVDRGGTPATGANPAVLRVDPVTGARTLVQHFVIPNAIAVQPAIAVFPGPIKLRNGKLRMRLGCSPQAPACVGTLVIETIKSFRLRAPASAAPKRGKTVRLGRVAFSLASGEEKRVRAKLTKRGRKLFKQRRGRKHRTRRKVAATATLAIDDSSLPPLQAQPTSTEVKVKKKGR